jgi:hypothetical protein
MIASIFFMADSSDFCVFGISDHFHCAASIGGAQVLRLAMRKIGGLLKICANCVNLRRIKNGIGRNCCDFWQLLRQRPENCKAKPGEKGAKDAANAD